MHILILNWRDPKNPKSGGAEIVTMEHAKAWIAGGHKVTWFTSKFKNCKKQEEIDGVNIVRRGNYITVYLLAPFYYFFSGNQFDLVIDEIHGIPFFTPLYVRVPKIAFIHEVAGSIWDYMYSFPINAIGKLTERIYFKFYKNVQFWTDADSTIGDLEQMGIKRENCLAINCPATNKSLNKFPNKEKNPTFIFVSRVVKMKGIEEVIKAFFYINKELKNAKLWIIGDGEQSYIKELNNIIVDFKLKQKIKYWGKVSNEKKLELMRKSNILLHASVKEGWGLVVIEAASQATPSVVFDVAGLRDSVKDGKTGIVLKENSAKEMAAQSIKLLKDEKKYNLFQNNCLRWAKSLTWAKATKQSRDLLDSLVSNR